MCMKCPSCGSKDDIQTVSLVKQYERVTEWKEDHGLWYPLAYDFLDTDYDTFDSYDPPLYCGDCGNEFDYQPVEEEIEEEWSPDDG